MSRASRAVVRAVCCAVVMVAAMVISSSVPAGSAPGTAASGTTLPRGSWDALTASGGDLRIRGWTLDPDQPTRSTAVHVYVDGVGSALVADRARPDVGSAFPGAGESHGFEASLRVGPGQHTVCVYAIDVDVPMSNSPLGCRVMGTQIALPLGNWEGLSASGRSLTIVGWALDPDHLASPSQVHVYVDGVGRALTADGARPDVAAAHSGAGAAHGFGTSVDVAPGLHTVCVYAIDTDRPMANSPLGCRTVETQSPRPIGNFESASASGPELLVTGWALDPTAPLAVLTVRVSIDGRTTTANTGQSRPDVAQAFPGSGSTHGFAFSVRPGPGRHSVCATAVGVDGFSTTALGCRDVVVGERSPMGSFDGGQPIYASFEISGWAFDPDRAETTVQVHLYVDGIGQVVQAERRRPDVAAAYPGAGERHGWQATITPMEGRSTTVCAYAIDDTGSSPNTPLGCRTFAHGKQLPVGNLETVEVDGPYLTVRGWALDLDQVANVPSVLFEVDGEELGGHYRLVERPDVVAAVPGAGRWSGWEQEFVVDAGVHTVCVVAQDMDSYRTVRIGCREVETTTLIPRGGFDSAVVESGQIVVSGWAYDPLDPDAPFSVVVEHTDGAFSRTVSTGGTRPDVVQAFPGAPATSGWSTSMWARPGVVYRVCVWTEERSAATFLGCREVRG